MDITNRILQNFRILFTVSDEFKSDLICLCSEIKKIDVFGYHHPERKIGEAIHFAIDTKEKENFIKLINKKVSVLRRKYNLSTAYQDVIESYLITNDVPEYLVNLYSEITPFVINNPDNEKEKMIVMPLPPEATITEIQNHWNYIKNKRKFLAKINSIPTNKNKIKTRKNLKRDLEIYELQKTGKSIKDIRKIINTKYESILIDGDVNKVIKDLDARATKIIYGK
jgi:hypothetical protein